MPFMSALLAVITAIVSGLALFHSQSSIPKLRKYEGKAEKAVQWSSAAEERLWATRYTIGAGFVAATISLLSALSFILTGSGWSILRVVWAGVLTCLVRYASQYMFSFWGVRTEVPLMDDYNEAISDSHAVIELLDVVVVGWATIAAFKVVAL